MTTCSTNECALEAYDEHDKCILHCKKGDYSNDFHKPVLLIQFFEQIIDCMAEEAFLYEDETAQVNKENFKEYLRGDNESVEIVSFSKEATIVLSNIAFPGRDSRDCFDYLNPLKKVGAIHFNYCHFNNYGLDLYDTKCFYQDCVFHDRWKIYNALVLGNVNNVIYQHCTFRNEVRAYPEGDGKYLINCQLFNNCEFRKSIDFGSIVFNAPVFNNTDDAKTKIESLLIKECVLNKKFLLNHSCIEKCFIEDTVFESKFEFKYNVVGELHILNTNYSKIVDTYETQYREFVIRKSIFEDFVGFEKCIFGEGGEISADHVARFVYATFMSFVNFRNTTFYSGLDIENINLKESPNFLNSEINLIHSNRETFRIVKDSFDKSGNYIEANKYFSKEMRKYKEELQGTNKTQEKVILLLNEKISNYGQSYVRPILLMVVAAVIYYLLILGYENNVIYKIHSGINTPLRGISGVLNGISESILPFSKMLKDGMEFVSLVFYIVFASLVWQILVAVKRHTKR